MCGKTLRIITDSVSYVSSFHHVGFFNPQWDRQGKGWQAWQGWGGDEGRTWANAIVERLNKQRTENSAQPDKVQFSAATEIQLANKQPPANANDWLTAVEQYRKELDKRVRSDNAFIKRVWSQPRLPVIGVVDELAA